MPKGPKGEKRPADVSGNADENEDELADHDGFSCVIRVLHRHLIWRYTYAHRKQKRFIAQAPIWDDGAKRSDLRPNRVRRKTGSSSTGAAPD